MRLKRFQARPAALRDAAYQIEADAGRVYPYNTAVTLRLTSSIHGSNRTVIGDSAFSSVSTATACRNYGMHFIGIIKTAHKQYPKAILQQASRGEPRGSFKVMRATSTEHPLYALAWADKKLKLLISTRGTTIQTDPSVRKRARLNEDGSTNRYQIEIPRPSMIKMFFKPFNAVDTNDQYRQGILKLEENWKTHSWATRTLTTVLGVIFVNSHLAMKLIRSQQDEADAPTFTDDMDKLALRLIFNPYLNDEQRELRPRAAEGQAILTPEAHRGSHVLASLIDSTKYRGKPVNSARVRCSVCRKPTRSYCVDCSDDSRGKYVAVCRPGSKKNGISVCYYEHKVAL
jgi:hypothetical protein